MSRRRHDPEALPTRLSQLATTFFSGFGRVIVFVDSQKETTWPCTLLSELSRRRLLSFLPIPWRTCWHIHITINTNPPLRSFAGLTASLAMFNTSFRAVLHSPESFFDTNPTGTISPFPLTGALSNMLRTNIVPLVQGSRHSGY